MALSATAIVEVRNGGSDTLNGGLFNPGATLNSNLAATNANTSSPVVTSATYNFTAGDVGHWLFIKTGTNWTPGWYQIASVAANAATLSAGVGQAILYSSTALSGTGFNTVAGCATTASPTSGSWAIDYSQVDAVPFSLTGLSTAAANAIILTASATVAMVGNGVQITGGANFTTGFYQINSVSAGVSLTVDRNCTTAAGSAGTAGLGGGLASPGQAGAIATVLGMITFVKYNATAFTATSASTNIAAGCVLGTTGTVFQGYDTSRWILNRDANRPTFKIGAAVSTATLFTGTNNTYLLWGFILDGNSQTSSRAVFQSGVTGNVKAINFAPASGNHVIAGNSGTQQILFCEVTSCTITGGGYAIVGTVMAGCYVYSNTVTLSSSVGGGIGPGTAAASAFNCISVANTIGFQKINCINCVAYNNSSHGFDCRNDNQHFWINCIAENNGGAGFATNVGLNTLLVNCASYNNTSGRTSGSGFNDVGSITGTGTFFTNAASGDFSLNNTASQGALCRATGYPATFPAGLTSNYIDVGAAQHQDAGGSSVIVPGEDNMLLFRKNGATSNILRLKLRSSSTGQGLTGLTSASSGLIISTICDNEASATTYTVAGSTVETITTLGTYAAPTATKCRFKEVDATNQPGVYEFQFADARFAVSSAKLLRISVSGAASLLECAAVVQLTAFDPDDSVRMGQTALPNAAAEAAGGLYTRGSGAGQLSQSANGELGVATLTKTLTTYTGNTVQTGDTYAVVNSGTFGNSALKTLIDTLTGYVDTEVAAIKAKTDNLPSDPADASDIASSFSTVNATLATIASYIDTEVAAIKAKTDNLPSDPADASDIAASFSSIAATLSTIAAYIDTEVAAIKAKTDNLPAAPAAVGDCITAGSVWDVVLSGHLTSGTTGAALNGAGAAGDPWGTALPGVYGAGTAGFIVGTNLNAPVGSVPAAVWVSPDRALTAFAFSVDVGSIHGTTLTGTGTIDDPWGPA